MAYLPYSCDCHGTAMHLNPLSWRPDGAALASVAPQPFTQAYNPSRKQSLGIQLFSDLGKVLVAGQKALGATLRENASSTSQSVEMWKGPYSCLLWHSGRPEPVFRQSSFLLKDIRLRGHCQALLDSSKNQEEMLSRQEEGQGSSSSYPAQ